MPASAAALVRCKAVPNIQRSAGRHERTMSSNAGQASEQVASDHTHAMDLDSAGRGLIEQSQADTQHSQARCGAELQCARSAQITHSWRPCLEAGHVVCGQNGDHAIVCVLPRSKPSLCKQAINAMLRHPRPVMVWQRRSPTSLQLSSGHPAPVKRSSQLLASRLALCHGWWQQQQQQQQQTGYRIHHELARSQQGVPESSSAAHAEPCLCAMAGNGTGCKVRSPDSPPAEPARIVHTIHWRGWQTVSLPHRKPTRQLSSAATCRIQLASDR